METVFLEFQTYMMKSTNELVHSLQANTQPPSNNNARLSQVYDEVTNLVARSSTSNNNSTQALPETRQNNSGYTHPFHPSQMITQASQYPPHNMIQVSANQHHTTQQITPSS